MLTVRSSRIDSPSADSHDRTNRVGPQTCPTRTVALLDLEPGPKVFRACILPSASKRSIPRVYGRHGHPSCGALSKLTPLDGDEETLDGRTSVKRLTLLRGGLYLDCLPGLGQRADRVVLS